jgi:hypothetical protein
VLTEPSAGDPIPPKCRLIEVRVSELRQIFNAEMAREGFLIGRVGRDVATPGSVPLRLVAN